MRWLSQRHREQTRGKDGTRTHRSKKETERKRRTVRATQVLLAGGNGSGGTGKRRQSDNNQRQKCVAGVTRISLVVVARHWRRWLVSGDDFGGGEVYVCSSLGVLTTFNEDGGKHRD